MKTELAIRNAAAGIAALLFGLVLHATAQTYSSDWFKIAGGGGTSTGGVYAVSGTIGQPDAGTAMTGGSYSLTGGYWSILAAVQTPGAPYLWVMKTPTNTVCVWWALSDMGWKLQATTNLLSAGSVWVDCPPPYQTNAMSIYYIESPPTGEKFYRLKQQ